MQFVGIILFIFLVIVAWLSIKDKTQRNIIEKERISIQNEYNNQYDEIFKNIIIPPDVDKVNFIEELNINGQVVIKRNQYYLWVDSNFLNYFPVRKKVWFKEEFNKIVRYKKLELNRIVWISIEGEVYREQKITGGGGGGSSVGKAIIGAAIAGGTGAIVASRNKVQPIKSELVYHDHRKVVLKYLNVSGREEKLSIDHAYYDKLIKLVPDKEKWKIEERMKNNPYK